MNEFINYEKEKLKIKNKNLTPKEYEKEIKRLLEQMKL